MVTLVKLRSMLAHHHPPTVGPRFDACLGVGAGLVGGVATGLTGVGVDMVVYTALVLIVGMVHFQKGARTMIEDYTGGTTRKLLIMAFAGFAYLMIACGIFALVKIAL